MQEISKSKKNEVASVLEIIDKLEIKGVDKRDEPKEREVDWHILERFGKRKNMSEDEILQERSKASIRAKVEHPFFIRQAAIWL